MFLRDGAGHSSPRRARTRGNAVENTLLSSARIGGVSGSRPYRIEKSSEKFFSSSNVNLVVTAMRNGSSGEDSRQRFFEGDFL
jgi:hypothetical protein